MKWERETVSIGRIHPGVKIYNSKSVRERVDQH